MWNFFFPQVWKQKWRKKSERFGGGADVCFRCGGKGHWASECRGQAGNLGIFLGIKQREKGEGGSFPWNFVGIVRFVRAGKDLGSFPEEEGEELPTLEEEARRTSGVFIPEIPGGSWNFGIGVFSYGKGGK